MNPPNSALNEILRQFDEEESQLNVELKSVPIAGGDEHDAGGGGFGLIVAGVAAMLVEFGFSLYFFTRVLSLAVVLAGALALGLVALLSLGPKLLLDSYYSDAQRAAAVRRHNS